jgi:N-acetylmuramoyl-L-alanine amidase
VAAWLPFLSRTSSDPPNLESQSLAASIQESLVARTQATNRGTRPQQFFVIANVRHPAVLVEGGFLSNKEDVVRLTNADYREQMAAGIADGILRYRDNLSGKETPLAVDLPAR